MGPLGRCLLTLRLHYYLPSTSTKQICKKAVGAVGDGDNGALKELNKL